MTDPHQGTVLYSATVVRRRLRSLWNEPAAPNPPRRVWRDWLLVGLLVPLAVVEFLFRDDLIWAPVALLLAVGLAPTLLWRRTRPLLVMVIAFGILMVLNVSALVASVGSVGMYSSVYVLLLLYALLRWGSGPAIAIGSVLAVATAAVGIWATYTSVGDTVAAVIFFTFPAVLGALVRYWSTSRSREVDQVKLREREQLARELHDTVAHHVSAIAIQAQAGRVLAESRPDAAVDALRVIEAEASRALAEMRAMVRALRDSDETDLAPQRGVGDIPLLAGTVSDVPRVEVSMDGELDDLSPSVAAAIYRLAQESITNAVRHARHATRIDVRVRGDHECVRLTVVDDGDPTSFGRTAWGYGLIGMTERATLLGGTLAAGPGADRGWTVSAMLPRAGARR